ncbi:MAG TPA: hypothetical protein DCQ31_17185 [Bacteroidales bacterium]|nr:hypothetical protein [Bacteroidales bacterium]
MQKKTTTIFKQLIANIIIPVVIALIILAFVNYTQTKQLLNTANEKQNLSLSDEIVNILAFQDESLRVIEESLNRRLEAFSDKLVFDYFKTTAQIKTADLHEIRNTLGMSETNEDIYIIEVSTGIIVNTTFEKDAGLNVYSFGPKFKEFIQKVALSDSIVSERISIETSTKRLKKYIYQASADNAYVIQTASYSEDADRIVNFVKGRLSSLSKKDESISNVDLFIQADVPFSLATGQTADNDSIIANSVKKVLETRANFVLPNPENDAQTYNFIFIQRENSLLYPYAVVVILSDASIRNRTLNNTLFKHLGLFGLTILIVVILIYRKTGVITNPLKKLVDNVLRISGGNFNERALVIGNNEIAELSIQFNKMIATIEDYYNDLENKVRERTAEINNQKEEIEAQRDSIEEQRDNLADKNRSLQIAYEEIDRQNRNITDSIHYASRIQNAILPTNAYIKKHLPESFVLFRPKDIVSGDFYWMIEKNNKVMIAAVDCTGHGVPGAFMSIVGNNELNNAVNIHGAQNSNIILDFLNQGVTNLLGQSKSSKIAVRDGMDLALCVIDKATHTLEFTGAFNPLFQITGSELIVHSPDKNAIGNFIEDVIEPFTVTKINYTPGDKFYLFSDGYVDQFGGPKDRKFMTKNFKELLLTIHEKEMEAQRDILNQSLDDWKGHWNQIDDVLVIGFKL